MQPQYSIAVASARKAITFIYFVTSMLVATASNAYDRPSLQELYPIEQFPTLFIASESWHPYSTIEDRDFWESLPDTIRQRLVSEGEMVLDQEWRAIPATEFLEFYRSGSKEPYNTSSFSRRHRLASLVVAECVEGDGRFLDAIINGIWAICEESFWGNAPSTWVQAILVDQVRFSNMRLHEIRTKLPDITRPGVDLWVGETAGLLAWTDYLLGRRLDAITPVIRKRIHLEVDRRMLTPCLERDFMWMEGRGNWTPWINSNWLTAVLLMERDVNRRYKALEKIFHSLDYYMQQLPPAGSCDEGPGYWRRSGGSLFACLDLLYNATKGAIDIFDTPLVGDIGRYIYRVHIADQYFMNFADASGTLSIPVDLVIRYGERINDKHLVALGVAFSEGDVLRGVSNLPRLLPALMRATTSEYGHGEPPLVRDSWLPDVQVMAARSQPGSTAGLFLGVKGGSNGEGHNHNDVGNFLVYADGLPVIIDIGPEAYTAQNSSAQRYDIWTMQSAYHNLPTIGGVMQQHGRKFAAKTVAYTMNETLAQITMDIAPAYPPSAGVVSWNRTLQLHRGQTIQLTDQYILEKSVDDLRLSFITPCTVLQIAPGILALQRSEFSRPILLRYDAQKLRVQMERIPLTDEGLRSTWGEQLIRIQLIADQPPLHDTWKITFLQDNTPEE